MEYPIVRDTLNPNYKLILGKRAKNLINNSIKETKNMLSGNLTVQTWKRIFEQNFLVSIPEYTALHKTMYTEMCNQQGEYQAKEIFSEEGQEVLVNAFFNKLESVNSKKKQLNMPIIYIQALKLIAGGIIIGSSFAIVVDKISDSMIKQNWINLSPLLKSVVTIVLASPACVYSSLQTGNAIELIKQKEVQKDALCKALKTIIQFEGKKFEILPKISLPIARKKVKHLLLCNIL